MWTKCGFVFNVHIGRYVHFGLYFEELSLRPELSTRSVALILCTGKEHGYFFLDELTESPLMTVVWIMRLCIILRQCPDKDVLIPPCKQVQCENCALLGYNAAGSGDSLPRFGTTCRSRLHGLKNPRRLTLEDGTDRLSQNVVKNYHYPLRNSPEGRSSHPLRGGSLKSCKVSYSVALQTERNVTTVHLLVPPCRSLCLSVPCISTYSTTRIPLSGFLWSLMLRIFHKVW